MATTTVVLDSHPLGLVTQKAGKSTEADACRAWMKTLLTNGIHVYVPEIADYEVRRELVRVQHMNSVTRLNDIKGLVR